MRGRRGRPAPARAEPPSIVIGQSLPLRGAAYSSATRVLQATQAYVQHINGLGGIHGRKLEVVTLDDEGDVLRHASNIQALLETHRAVALVNCLGDASCERASALANRYRVPLFGPISGARALRTGHQPYTIPLRASYEGQAAALMRQLTAMGNSAWCC